jgi:hypothetical protein
MVGAALVAVGGVIVAKRVWQAVGPRLVLLCEAAATSAGRRRCWVSPAARYTVAPPVPDGHAAETMA